MSQKLEQPKVFLVTGCSSGLGLELAYAVLAAGHKLIATSRNPRSTPEIISKVTSLGGVWDTLDVTSADLESQLKHALGVYGRIDVLINNAGIGMAGAIEDFTHEATMRMFNTNMFGPLRLTQLLLPHMRSLGAGAIVNISSGSTLQVQPALGLYAASKAALSAYSDCLAIEAAPFNIKVFTLIPGDMRTPFIDPERVASSGAVMPLSKPYKGTAVEYVVNVLLNMHGNQSIDPTKVAERVVQIVLGNGSGEVQKAMASGLTNMPFGVESADAMKAKGLLMLKQVDELKDIWGSCEIE